MHNKSLWIPFTFSEIISSLFTDFYFVTITTSLCNQDHLQITTIYHLTRPSSFDIQIEWQTWHHTTLKNGLRCNHPSCSRNLEPKQSFGLKMKISPQKSIIARLSNCLNPRAPIPKNPSPGRRTLTKMTLTWYLTNFKAASRLLSSKGGTRKWLTTSNNMAKKQQTLHQADQCASQVVTQGPHIYKARVYNNGTDTHYHCSTW